MAEILVFSPDPEDAGRYERILKASLPGVGIARASTLAEADPFIGEVAILFGWKFPKGLIGRGRSLRWIHKVSAGVEDVVFDPDRPRGLRLSRTGGAAIAPRMVEYVLGAIFASTQQFVRALRQSIDRRWEPYLVDRAGGKTVGVAGLGDIGTEIAKALIRNGMRVVAWRRSDGPPPEGCPIERIYRGPDELAPFASACDFVVSVLPTTDETRRVFNAAVFRAMRQSAVFINVGRGASVDEAALAQAVAEGRIAGAVLDVFETEPLPPTSPLWSLDRVLITPHVSGPIIPEDVVPAFLENLSRFRSGLPLLKEVDLTRGY